MWGGGRDGVCGGSRCGDWGGGGVGVEVEVYRCGCGGGGGISSSCVTLDPKIKETTRTTNQIKVLTHPLSVI